MYPNWKGSEARLVLRLRRPLVRFGGGPVSGSGARAARGWDNWQRSGTAICRRASDRARLLARIMLPTALPVCRINLPMRADEAR
jgi:hypothetical protein